MPVAVNEELAIFSTDAGMRNDFRDEHFAKTAPSISYK
jgi:hypothetical protein